MQSSLPDSGKKEKEKASTRKVAPEGLAAASDHVQSSNDDKKSPTRKIDVFDETPTGRLTAEDSEARGTTDQDQTLRDIAERISLAQAITSTDEEELKKGRKIREIIPIGKSFQGKYQIVKLIGSGGMGQVYLANHLVLANQVAIKVLNTNFVADDDEEAIERFKREARATASIDHPNAVKVFDFGVEENICYLVMEYLAGESLRKRLAKRKRLPFTELTVLVKQVCSVLEIMHRKGIVHRDLKPDNIFFHTQEDQEIVKVLDFGIAKISGSTLNEGRLTTTGALLGTPHYMSPEQCQGMRLDGRSDLYAFGIIVYELISGRLPFEAENTLSMLFKHVRDTPKPLNELVPEIPMAIAEVVMKTLEKNPKDRFQTAKEFEQAFCQAVEKSSLTGESKINTLSSTGKTNELNIQTTIETAILPIVEGQESQQIQVNSKANQAYDVATRSHQATATRPVGRPVQIEQQNLSSPQILEKAEQEKTSAIKYLIPISLVLVIVTVGVWKILDNQPTPNTNIINTTNTPTTSPTPTVNPSLKDFVLIKATQVNIGSDKNDCKTIPDCKIGEFEKPAYSITLTDYYLSKYEVTNADYDKFVRATNRVLPSNWDKTRNSFPIGTDKLPVTFISWEDAKAYCEWRSKEEGLEFRLPSEQEWEYAARGADGRFFPWGDNWDPSLVNGAKPKESVTSPSSVDLAPNNTTDISPLGIFAMAGNVAEWTSSDFRPYPGSNYKATNKDLVCKVVRGGSFNAAPADLRISTRFWYEPTKKDSNIGFRLAVSVK